MSKHLIFDGAPSQVINLPALLKAGAVIVLIGAIHLYASKSFALNWFVLLIQAVAVMAGAVLPFIKTAFTEIVIDTERIIWRQGVFKSRASSLELSAIRSITCIQPWWQRLFGTASLIIMTSDPAHPQRRLPGIRGAEQLRLALEDAMLALRK
ncbi:PH domain-containing protein [Burkholderia sp. L27(2015)]|uniref:PH domain-containing protein n=1 Tax=Burkholderia sp. L27(2015) TaxID=1641858 RepID=UPI00131B4C76|nr:PH domain-containing protein [Burkholderia sp. L27(2015)]